MRTISTTHQIDKGARLSPLHAMQPVGEDRIFPFRCCGGRIISAPTVRWCKRALPGLLLRGEGGEASASRMRWTRRKAERFSRMIGRMLCIRYPVPLISHFVTAFPRGGSQEPHPYLLLRGEGGEASASRMRWSCRKAERFSRMNAVSPKTKTSPRTVRRLQTCAPQVRCPQAIGSAAEAWRCAGSAQRHLCNEAKRSGSEGVYNRAWRRAIKRATAPL